MHSLRSGRRTRIKAELRLAVVMELDNDKFRALVLTHASERKLGHFYAMPEHLVVLKQLDFNGLEGVIQG